MEEREQAGSFGWCGCQVAPIVTPEGLPLAYEMFPGNPADKSTLPDMLKLMQKRYGQAGRSWVMDRSIPTEAVLEETGKGTRRTTLTSKCARHCASNSGRRKAKSMCWPKAAPVKHPSAWHSWPIA